MTSILSFHSPTRSRSGAVTAPTDPTATTSRERLWLPVAIVLAALIGIVGWMLLVSPLRDDAAAASDQAATVTAQADGLQSRVAAMQAQESELPRLQAELAAAQAALPTSSALPAFLRSLQDLGSSTGTTVVSLTASEPDGSTGAASNGGAGVGQVYRVPVTITVAGGQDALTAFVTGLQTGQPRAVLVDGVSESTAAGGATTLTVSMSAFVAPTAGSGNGS